MTEGQKLDFDLVGLNPEVGPKGQRFSPPTKVKQKFLDDLNLTY